MSKKYRKDRGTISFFIGLLTINLYWPYFFKGPDNIGIFGKGCLIFYWPHERNVLWKCSFAICFLGLGFGIAWNHCDNPNYIYEDNLPSLAEQESNHE